MGVWTPTRRSGRAWLPPPDMDIGVDGAAIQDQRLVSQQGIEVGPGKERLRDLPARDMVDFRLPVLFQTDDVPHAVGVAGSEALQAGIRQVGQQAVAPPGLIDLQMPAVMLAGRTEMVAAPGPRSRRRGFYGPSWPRTPRSQETPRAGHRGP